MILTQLFSVENLVLNITIITLDTWFPNAFIGQNGNYTLNNNDLKKLKSIGNNGLLTHYYKFNLSADAQPTTSWHMWFIAKPTFLETGASGGAMYFCFSQQNNMIVQMSINYATGSIQVKVRY